MLTYIIRRILQILPGLFIVVTIVFIGMRVLPGDPAIAILGNYATAESIAKLREQLGLNEPLWKQYISFIGDLARGDLGVSITSQKPVGQLIISVLPHSGILAISSIFIASLIGIPTGILSSIRRNQLSDYIGRVAALIGISTPSYYLGVILLLIFAVKLDLFPVVGAGDLSNPLSILWHLILPASSLGLVNAAIVMRVTRSTMLDVMNEDYIQTARSKGLKESTVTYKHALRNALLSVVTVVGVYLGVILGTVVLTEVIFTRPGLGRLLVEGVYSRDYTTVQSSLVVFAVSIAFINLITDLSYGLINPRIRFG